MRTRNVHRAAGGVLVVGAGVSGLTTALCLARRGLHVTVVADQVSPGITSNVAGALWEWPPAVCGRHHDEVLLAPSTAWSLTSYERFRELADAPATTGVFLRPANFYFRQPVKDNPGELTKNLWERAVVADRKPEPAHFRHVERHEPPAGHRLLIWLPREALPVGGDQLALWRDHDRRVLHGPALRSLV